jgi:hypothetical protein
VSPLVPHDIKHAQHELKERGSFETLIHRVVRGFAVLEMNVMKVCPSCFLF